MSLNVFQGLRGARRDYRLTAMVLAIVGTVLLGYLVSLLPGRGVTASPVATRPTLNALLKSDGTAAQARRAAAETTTEAEDAEEALSNGPSTKDPRAQKVKSILQGASAKIRAKQYDEAITTLHDLRQQIKHEPRAYLVMARALEGKADYLTARDFYAAAIDRDPYLADAYFGFATSSEALSDLEAAIGGMRNFLHVQPNADPQKLKIVQARSAIWEWESKLGRGAWGATKGVPPGFTADELKRDGRGVGIKMPIPGADKADGGTKYEIKHQDKFQIFKP